MKFQNVSLVHVYYMQGNDKLSMGRLALKDRKIFFEYTPTFIAKNTGVSQASQKKIKKVIDQFKNF